MGNTYTVGLQEFVTGQATQDDSIKSALNQTSKLQSEMAACMALASASAEQMKSLQGSLDKLDAAGETGPSVDLRKHWQLERFVFVYLCQPSLAQTFHDLLLVS